MLFKIIGNTFSRPQTEIQVQKTGIHARHALPIYHHYYHATDTTMRWRSFSIFEHPEIAKIHTNLYERASTFPEERRRSWISVNLPKASTFPNGRQLLQTGINSLDGHRLRLLPANPAKRRVWRSRDGVIPHFRPWIGVTSQNSRWPPPPLSTSLQKRASSARIGIVSHENHRRRFQKNFGGPQRTFPRRIWRQRRKSKLPLHVAHVSNFKYVVKVDWTGCGGSGS